MSSVGCNKLHVLFSVAVSICLIGMLARCAEAGSTTAFQVATEVMMADVTAEMQIASAESGTGAVISTTNGVSTLSPGGDQFSISFTAGSVVVADQATFTPSGGTPGAGTWSIASTDGATGSVTVTFNSGTSTYDIGTLYSYPKTDIPKVGPVNNREESGYYFPDDNHSFYFYQWSFNGTKYPNIYIGTDVQISNG